MKYFIFSFTLSLLLVMGVGATTGSPAHAADIHPAEALVRQTTDLITTQIKQEKDAIDKNNKVLHELVNKIVLPHFDFNKMSMWVLGKYWRKANKNQKQEFTNQFRILLVRTYANALADSAERKVDYLPIRNKSETDVIVRTEIEQPGSFALPINYKMYLKNSDWKVYDVNIDGISLVTNYRTSFSTEIRKSNIDGLISKLTKRNQQAKNE
jgi:phospholipid transport system substrate-binding protein